jgi:hypothetical protein
MAITTTPDLRPHAVALRGPSSVRPAAPAVLVDIEADDFVTALNHAITSTAWPRFGWPAALPIARLADDAAPRVLFQPVHRRFNVVLADAHCVTFGTPRLALEKIESCGFVVRRWVGPAGSDADARANPANWQAWHDAAPGRSGSSPGWHPFATAEAFDADPDPERRPRPRTGSADVDARLAGLRASLPAEASSQLHRLMPDVVAHTGRTLLWGVVPTSDSLRTTRPAAVDYTEARAPGPSRDSFVDHLSPYLRRVAVRDLPGARGRFDATWLAGVDPVDAAEPDSATNAGNGDGAREQFAAFVRQLAFEFDINGRGLPLRALLDEIAVGYRETILGVVTRTTVGAAAFMSACARVATDEAAPAVDIPDDFGPPPADWLGRFVDAALTVLATRAADARLLEGRFDDVDALFAIRAFVRVRTTPGCPPRLVWSDLTPLYRVAPWFASTGSPQARIALPDRASMAAMKPNVAFDVPPGLQNLLMRNKPEDLLKRPKAGGELGLGWICSFSIPVITICAFVLLNVILALLNLVFFWLPLVKICLPVPKKR